MTTPLAQDPDELFDVVTADGRATGITKRRADVHRDGDWHRSIHVWVFGVDAEGPFILMNQRGHDKDTHPGLLDAPVAGHLGAGESVEDAFREFEEEIGIPADLARFIHVGTRPRASEHSTPGVIDRELQEIFLYRDDRLLSEYRPNAAELEAIVRMRLEGAIRLFAGEVPQVPGERLDAHTHAQARIEVTREMLIPTILDRYFLRAALAVDRLLRGDRYIVL